MSLRYKLFLINLFGLTLLLCGSLYLDNFRNRLIESSVQSLKVQAQTIAKVISASAAEDENVFAEGIDIRENANTYLIIYTVFARAVIAELLDKEKYRAIVYDRFGTIVHDSDIVSKSVRRKRLYTEDETGLVQTALLWINRLADFIAFPFVDDTVIVDSKDVELTRQKAVESAFSGKAVYFAGWNQNKELVINFVQPVQRYRAVLGVLSLTAHGDEINQVIEEQQKRVIIIFLIASFFVIILSFLLAYTIVNPIRRLSEAAKRIALPSYKNHNSDIPDFSLRKDEIGDLSAALQGMTNKLIKRIEDIERFAADVTHELKNPIASLASAIEILPKAKKQTDKKKLLNIMGQDVKRIDRLISDIAESSRVDAELNRQDKEIIDMQQILTTYIEHYNSISQPEAKLRLYVDKLAARQKWNVHANELRIGQVIRNLVDNAIYHADSKNIIEVYLTSRDNGAVVEVIVADSGKGIEQTELEKIFERFYTDKEERTKNHSGLGLSISRQIIEAHGGKIWAEKRPTNRIENEKPDQNGIALIIHLPHTEVESLS